MRGSKCTPGPQCVTKSPGINHGTARRGESIQEKWLVHVDKL